MSFSSVLSGWVEGSSKAACKDWAGKQDLADLPELELTDVVTWMTAT
jgi:hypothetical protein